MAHLPTNGFVMRTDVKSFYASIDYIALMDRLARHIDDRTILNLARHMELSEAPHGFA